MKYLILIATVLTLTACAGSSEDVAKAQGLGIPLVVNHSTVGTPDYAQGMPVYIGFTNASSRPVKYIDFEVEPFNRYGDVQRSDIGRKWTSHDTQPLGHLIQHSANIPICRFSPTPCKQPHCHYLSL
jgi:hypothetical protein